MFNRLFWLMWFSGALSLADMRDPNSVVAHIFWASFTAVLVALFFKAKEIAVKKLETEEPEKPRRATREDVR